MRFFPTIIILTILTLPCLLFNVRTTIDYTVINYQTSQNSPAHALWNTNWVATDGLGRLLPTPTETGPARAGKYVGIFYFLWHGAYRDNIYDISKILRTNPTKPKYGPKGVFHWWGEPEAGYFRGDDPWVIRRNLQMLINAGIDILFFDATNRDIYFGPLEKLCAISQEMRRQGQQTPYICFVTNTNPKETVADLYTNFYAKNKYADLWFRWQGKPLMLGRQEEITDPAQRDFFTWRYSWQFTEAKAQPGHWQWFDTSPQDYGWVNDPNKPEQIPVAVASHPVFGVGKSNVGGRGAAVNRYYITPVTSQGRYFNEQWKRALTVDPTVVFVTGWNEWLAQRFIADTNDRSMVFKNFIDHKMRQGETFFQDLYNEEFNRDIEPMKGGYTDNYYYQLVANVRRFKGLSSLDKPTPLQTVSINGKFAEWSSIKPVFKDFQGDIANRDWLRYDNKARLINKTGRNDIVESRITYDKDFIYAYAQTARPLTPITGRNWMLLFLDIDRSKKTGWEGYDLVVNRQVTANGRTSVHRWAKGSWQVAGQALYTTAGNKLEMKIPRHLFNQKSTIAFDFHWADNIQRWNTINEFFLNGDSAPDRRFNYRYVGR